MELPRIPGNGHLGHRQALDHPQTRLHHPAHPGWEHSEEREFPRFVADVLHGRLVPRTLTTALGTQYEGWAAPEDVTAANEYASPQTTPPAPA
ncbi:hypothetical protein ABZV34_37815 [Streptomyces sp. NPDC005195]|uniref:hypothetical protein n=1 Tax=Streptomyces sp. NPDC005195 TaxID=3154561 RepID=UPI0033A036B6